MKQTLKGIELAKKLGISPSRGIEAVLKAQLIAAITKEAEKAADHSCRIGKKNQNFLVRRLRYFVWKLAEGNSRPNS